MFLFLENLSLLKQKLGYVIAAVRSNIFELKYLTEYMKYQLKIKNYISQIIVTWIQPLI